MLRLGLCLGPWGVGPAEIQGEEPRRTYVSIGVEALQTLPGSSRVTRTFRSVACTRLASWWAGAREDKEKSPAISRVSGEDGRRGRRQMAAACGTRVCRSLRGVISQREVRAAPVTEAGDGDTFRHL